MKSLPERRGSSYPPPFDQIAKDRVRRRLGDAAGLTQFGVNLLQLPPGAASSQRHWHSGEDEFVFVVSGEVTLVTDKGEELLRAGRAPLRMNHRIGLMVNRRSAYLWPEWRLSRFATPVTSAHPELESP